MIEKMIEDVKAIIEMIESDMELTGKFAMSESTKKYATSIRQELEDMLNEWGNK